MARINSETQNEAREPSDKQIETTLLTQQMKKYIKRFHSNDFAFISGFQAPLINNRNKHHIRRTSVYSFIPEGHKFSVQSSKLRHIRYLFNGCYIYNLRGTFKGNNNEKLETLRIVVQ